MTESATEDNLFEFHGRKYVIGQGRLGKQDSKTENSNYYLLTLAAIAKELQGDCDTAFVNLAVGVPLTLYGKEKRAFKEYLLR